MSKFLILDCRTRLSNTKAGARTGAEEYSVGDWIGVVFGGDWYYCCGGGDCCCGGDDFLIVMVVVVRVVVVLSLLLLSSFK